MVTKYCYLQIRHQTAKILRINNRDTFPTPSNSNNNATFLKFMATGSPV